MTRKTTKPFSGRITAPSAPWLAPESPEAPEPSDRPKSEVQIQITDIHLPPKQPRRYFDAEALQTLATSITQHGVLQPLLVRPHSAGGYELVAGELQRGHHLRAGGGGAFAGIAAGDSAGSR